MIRDLLNILGFLTILPTGRNNILTPQDFGRFPRYYPIVGAIIGLLLIAFWYISSYFLPLALTAALTVVIYIIITRAFHLDGLADSADALFSHKSLAKKLEIMKDSQQGTFGVIAIVLSIILKMLFLVYAATPFVTKKFHPEIIFFFPIWGRTSAAIVAACCPYIRKEGGLGQHIVEHTNNKDLVIAIVTSLSISFFCSYIFSLAAIFFTTIFSVIFGYFLVWLWKKSLGGITGDLLGASTELGEIFPMLFFLLLIYN